MSRRTPPHVRPLIVIGFLVSLAALGTLALAESTAMAPAALAATACSTSSPSSQAYTVTVCIVSPSDGSTLVGPRTVSSTVTIKGPTPGLSRLVYSLGSQYLLTYFANAPYSFTLPSNRFADGSYPLSVQAAMGDGFTTTSVSVNVTLSNGLQPPPVPTFTPALGTTPAAGQPLLVAAIGDGAGGEIPEANVVSLIASQNPNLFLYLGDVYEQGSIAEFYNYYRPATFFGRFFSITNPTVGNHEYLTNQAAGYFDYWNNPPGYYSFTTGNWHFVSLNTNCSDAGGCGIGSPQYNWLVQDLSHNTNLCTLAFYHEPLFDIGPEGEDPPAVAAIWSALAQYGVEIVLNGHDHDYQRWAPLDGNGSPAAHGVTEFILGGGGHAIQPFATTDNRMAVGYDTTINPVTFGSLFLRLYPTSAQFQYINTSGVVLDQGTIVCGPNAAYIPMIIK